MSTRVNNSYNLIIIQRFNSKRLKSVYVFLCIVLLAVRMVADVTETRYIISSLEFKTWTKKTIKDYFFKSKFSYRQHIVFIAWS